MRRGRRRARGVVCVMGRGGASTVVVEQRVQGRGAAPRAAVPRAKAVAVGAIVGWVCVCGRRE